MPKTSSRQARAVATYDAIVRGAAITYLRVGYGEAKLSDIVSEAGISNGALYFHFKKREDIARAVIERQHELALTTFPRIGDRRPALEQLIDTSYQLMQLIEQDPIVAAGVKITIESAGAQIDAHKPFTDWFGSVKSMLKSAAADGELLDTMDPSRLAIHIVSSFVGIQIISRTLDGGHTVTSLLKDMWMTLIPAITPPAAAQGYLETLDALHLQYAS